MRKRREKLGHPGHPQAIEQRWQERIEGRRDQARREFDALLAERRMRQRQAQQFPRGRETVGTTQFLRLGDRPVPREEER